MFFCGFFRVIGSCCNAFPWIKSFCGLCFFVVQDPSVIQNIFVGQALLRAILFYDTGPFCTECDAVSVLVSKIDEFFFTVLYSL